MAAYLRVSTDKQTVLNQKDEIMKFCGSRDLRVNRWCTETVSGTTRENDRKLGALLKRLKKGDVLIVTEVSRLSRKMINIMNIINNGIEKGITIHSIKEGYTFDESINSKVLAFTFGITAEMERNLISQRTRQALALRKSAGVKLGRPVGSTRPCVLVRREGEVRNLLSQGKSYREIAFTLQVSRETVRQFCIRQGLDRYHRVHRGDAFLKWEGNG